MWFGKNQNQSEELRDLEIALSQRGWFGSLQETD